MSTSFGILYTSCTSNFKMQLECSNPCGNSRNFGRPFFGAQKVGIAMVAELLKRILAAEKRRYAQLGAIPISMVPRLMFRNDSYHIIVIKHAFETKSWILFSTGGISRQSRYTNKKSWPQWPLGPSRPSKIPLGSKQKPTLFVWDQCVGPYSMSG